MIGSAQVSVYPAAYAVARDGKFLMMKELAQGERPGELIVVRNWAAELDQSLPVDP